MPRIPNVFAAAALVPLSMLPGIASAQGPLPYQTPSVSPYLNLLRQGSPQAINYYNLVRPQIEFNNSIQQLNQQVGVNRQGLSDLQSTNRTNSALPPTGFIPQFQTQRSYFLTYAGGAGGSGQIPNRGTGRASATLPGAMGAPALGSPALGVPAMGAPRFQ
jgi:hypothetical protein